jgi:WD40 repeat protein
MKATLATLAVVTIAGLVTRDSPAAAQSGAATSTAFDASRAVLVAQIGHQRDIGAIALSPDASRIVSVDNDGVAKIWHLPSGRLLRTIKAHSGSPTVAAFSPDGNLIVTAGSLGHTTAGPDPYIRIWNATSGALVRTQNAERFISPVAISPHGTRFVFEHENTTLARDIASGQILHTLDKGTVVDAVAVSRDGSRIVIAARNSVTIWDAATGKLHLHLEGHRGLVKAIEVFPDGSRVVTGDADGTIRIWDMATGAPLHVLDGQIGPVLSIAVSPDGRRMAASSERRLRVWDAQSERPICTMSLREGRLIKFVAFVPDGPGVVTADSRGSVRWVDVQSCAQVRTLSLRGEMSVVLTLGSSSDGRQLISGDNRAMVRRWDPESGRLVQSWAGLGDPAVGAQISGDGRVIATGGSDGMKVWDAASGQLLRSFAERSRSITLSPDGRHVVARYYVTATILDVTSGALVRPARELSLVPALAFSPDGKRIVTVNSVPRRPAPWRGVARGHEYDPVAKIWDTETGQLLLTLQRSSADGHRSPGDISSVTFSSDGRRLVTAGHWRADIWDTVSGELVRTLRYGSKLDDFIRSVAFFPDGSRIVTVLHAKACIWDVTSGSLLGTIGGDGKHTVDDAIVLNNGEIATRNRDGTIGLWDATALTLSATLIAVGQSDYIVLRGDGTYDLSDGARDALHLVDGNEWSPVTPEYEAAYRRRAQQ